MCYAFPVRGSGARRWRRWVVWVVAHRGLNPSAINSKLPYSKQTVKPCIDPESSRRLLLVHELRILTMSITVCKRVMIDSRDLSLGL